VRKSVFGLIVAGATLVSAIVSALPADAINFVYNDIAYNVTTYKGSYDTLRPILTDSKNLLWGNANLSAGLAGVVGSSLGMPNCWYNQNECGPYFGYEEFVEPSPFTGVFLSLYFYHTATFVGDFVGVSQDWYPVSTVDGLTYATATAVPEPLTILGSIAATGFVAAFNRIKNKKSG
jgi:hypothetical protein